MQKLKSISFNCESMTFIDKHNMLLCMGNQQLYAICLSKFKSIFSDSVDVHLYDSILLTECDQYYYDKSYDILYILQNNGLFTINLTPMTENTKKITTILNELVDFDGHFPPITPLLTQFDTYTNVLAVDKNHYYCYETTVHLLMIYDYHSKNLSSFMRISGIEKMFTCYPFLIFIVKNGSQNCTVFCHVKLIPILKQEHLEVICEGIEISQVYHLDDLVVLRSSGEHELLHVYQKTHLDLNLLHLGTIELDCTHFTLHYTKGFSDDDFDPMLFVTTKENITAYRLQDSSLFSPNGKQDSKSDAACISKANNKNSNFKYLKKMFSLMESPEDLSNFPQLKFVFNELVDDNSANEIDLLKRQLQSQATRYKKLVNELKLWKSDFGDKNMPIN
eukprot:NODE_335_length_9311_cov_0.760313.p3 type:complete len:391 gc:universal NODE_335_length_9311_cov_0.760313:2602-1430(-)